MQDMQQLITIFVDQKYACLKCYPIPNPVQGIQAYTCILRLFLDRNGRHSTNSSYLKRMSVGVTTNTQQDYYGWWCSTVLHSYCTGTYRKNNSSTVT